MSSALRLRLVAGVLLGIAAAGLVWPAASSVKPTAATRTGAADPAVIIAVIPSPPAESLGPVTEKGEEPHDLVLRQLERLGLSIGLASTSQGDYDQRQALLDLTQGTRQPATLYGSPSPRLSLVQDGQTWRYANWPEVTARARRASVTIEPGLLADSVPGGASFVGLDRAPAAAIAAADRAGRVADVSFGTQASLVERAVDATSDHQLVVVGLPSGDAGLEAISALASTAASEDLLIVVHLPPTPPERAVTANIPSRFFNQTAAGLSSGPPRSELRSTTTRQPGLVSLIDLAPTALDHLGLDIPDRMRGQTIDTAGRGDAAKLEDARRRWHDVRSGRQAGSLRTIVLAATLFFLVAGAVVGLRRAMPPSLRLAGLGLLWWPTAALAVAPLSISAGPTESLVIAAIALALAALSDRMLGWPKAPRQAAVAGIGLLAIDLARGGQLLTRSVLAPSVSTGNRFYGISNEIEPLLPILVLAGIAAAATTLSVRRLRWLYAAAGLVLCGVVGAGRLGADVGGVITIAAAFAVAGVALQPVKPRLVTVLAVCAIPVLALGLLVVVDLVFGGGGHLANNLTRAGGLEELWELVARRYELALRALLDVSNAVSLGIACLVVAFCVRNRSLLLPVFPNRAWSAALVGGFAGGVAGALSNDSGPVLLTNAVVALGAVAAYLRGAPLSEG